MRVALVGGIDRLQNHYRNEAAKLGVELRIFNKSETDLQAKLGKSEAVLLFTGKVSHQARLQVMGAAQSRNIPVYQSHNCGVCALRSCLSCVKVGMIGNDPIAA
jgi:ABC-type uncharacterized transport system substrate-binding protein